MGNKTILRRLKRVMALVIATFDAFPIVEKMLFMVRAGGPEVIIGHVYDFAEVIAPAPVRPFAGGCAAVFRPVAISAATDGFKLIQIQFFAFAGPMLLDFFPYFFGVEARVGFG